MLKTLFFAAFLGLFITGCEKDNSAEPSPSDIQTPRWLIEKISDMSKDKSYFGTSVHGYNWNGQIVYHIYIPASSCANCEVYDRFGNKLRFENDSTFQDYAKTRKNDTLIWQWK